PFMPNRATRTSGRLGIREPSAGPRPCSSRATRSGMTSVTLASHDGEEVLFEGRAALVPSFTTLVLSILTLGLWLVVRWFQTLGRTYRITSRRIVVETG